MNRSGETRGPKNGASSTGCDKSFSLSRAEIAHEVEAAETGDEGAGSELLTLLYDELRALAQSRLAKIPPGNTLQPTALVHEAYLKIVGKDPGVEWNGRSHFFGAAAEAMRQILVDQVRRKSAKKRGGDRGRVEMDDRPGFTEPPNVDILALDEALSRLEAKDPLKARMVKLRYFAGMSREETAAVLELAPRTFDRQWRYALALLRRDLTATPADPPAPGDYSP